MTKEELLRFLEPFTNDIKIVQYSSEWDEFNNISIQYKIAHQDYGSVEVEKNDGFIIIYKTS